MSGPCKVGTTADLAPGAVKTVEVEGRTLALFRLGDRYYALDNKCTHWDGPLGEGFVEGDSITCPWHGAQFQIETGVVCRAPARRDVRRYPVRVEGSDLLVDLDPVV
ncbi:MAG: non-heme iron oxygenase ferredoxin subunit [Planctomycetota bacterium]|nr:non-heme iron oxygenase ferredoxin subunit [Planctomycetota bacterium]